MSMNEQMSFQQIKQEMIDAGYEVRKVLSRAARISDSYACQFVIVWADRPKIDCVYYEPPNDFRVVPVIKQDFSPKWIIGWGETEETAWQRAAAEWPNIPF